MGIYDLPAMIDYVLNKTGEEKLLYVGFSQGCTQLLVMGSLKPEYNKKVQYAILLAPGAFMGNIKGALSLLKPIVYPSMVISQIFVVLLTIFLCFLCQTSFLLAVFCCKRILKRFFICTQSFCCSATIFLSKRGLLLSSKTIIRFFFRKKGFFLAVQQVLYMILGFFLVVQQCYDFWVKKAFFLNSTTIMFDFVVVQEL